MGVLPRARGVRRGAAALVLVVATALTLSACGSSGYSYVKTSNDTSGTYFKLPESWTVYGEDAVTKKLGLSPAREKLRKTTSWTVAFDGNSNPSLKHFDQAATARPFGIAEVRELDQQERDTFSIEAMRNAFVRVDDFSQQGGQVEVLRNSDFTRAGGFRGLRFTFNVQVPNSDQYVTFDQTTIVDPDTSHLHLLVVSCTATCYEREKGTIETVIDSWTVKER